MINVSLKASEIIQQDEIALEALREGVLNLSAYAQKIHRQVEEVTHKEVKKGTIVVALTRMKKELIRLPPLRPEIEITNLSVKSSLNAYTYEKTLDIQRKIAMLHPFLLPMNDLLSVTEGPSEVTIIFAQKSEALIQKHFHSKPKAVYTDVVAVTVQFPEELSHIPNVLYGILSKLAVKRINLVEIVSTFTEISFLVTKEDMAGVLAALKA